MPTPSITASTRYFDVAITRIYYLPAIASATFVPTRAEMTAGINLTPEIADLSGWVVGVEYFDTQNLNQVFRTKAPGIRTAPDSSLTFYTSKTGVDARVTLFPGVTGFIMFLDGGDSVGNRAEVYPITVGSIGVTRNAGNDVANSSTALVASMVQIGFAITGTPNQAVTVPA